MDKPRYKWSEFLVKYLDENSYDYEMKNSGSQDNFIVRFENIFIKNSRNRQHYIPEIFVRFWVNSNGELRGMEGARVKYCPSEVGKGYRHSHLQAVTTGDFTSFCLGHGEINEFFDHRVYSASEANAQLFMLMVETYLQWESLEGGPHIKMEYIAQTIREMDDASAIQSIFKKPLPIKSDYIDFMVVDGKIQVSETWATEQLEPNCVEKDGKYYFPDIGFKTQDQIEKDLARSAGYVNGIGSIYFKGQYIKPSIVPDRTDADAPKLIVHPTLLKEYVNRIQTELNSYLLNEYDRTEG